MGDKLAVVLNPDSADEVLMAVNVNRLQGQWRDRGIEVFGFQL